MERPSHTNLHTPHAFSSRVTSLGLAIILPALMAWAMEHGTVAVIIHNVGPLVLTQVQQPVKPQLPPPAIKLQTVIPPAIVQPAITIAPDPNASTITATVAPPSEHKTDVAPPVVIPAPGDHAAIGVMATHTIPPYPALAQRLGKEGVVTLRLTVLPTGRVGEADIVTSSGSDDLDHSAQAWVTAHWAYKPAVEKGQPVASQTVVNVKFSLADQH